MSRNLAESSPDLFSFQPVFTLIAKPLRAAERLARRIKEDGRTSLNDSRPSPRIIRGIILVDEDADSRFEG